MPGFLLACAVRRMPDERREWGDAMLAELDQVQTPIQRWRFALGCIGVALCPPMRAGSLQSLMNLTRSLIPGNPRAATLVGLVLALPISLMLAIAVLQIEPFHGALKDWFTADDGVRQTTSSFVAVITAFLLLPVASLITLAPVARAVRSGNTLRASLLNLSLGIIILLIFTAILGGVFIDQLPCFLGKPNCD
jgi:hypothetical protein